MWKPAGTLSFTAIQVATACCALYLSAANTVCRVPGIPATVVAAASCDDAIAIMGYTLFIALAVRTEGANAVWAAMHGPLSVVFGLLAGGIAGMICALTRIWDNGMKRTAVLFLNGAAPSC